VLEVTARAITYYLDVSAECTRRIVAVEGAVKAMCTRLEVVDLSNRYHWLAVVLVPVLHHKLSFCPIGTRNIFHNNHNHLKITL
jgi:hypothetical protein